MTSSYLFRLSVVLLSSSSLALAARPVAAKDVPQTQPTASATLGQDSWRVYRESCRQILNGDFHAAYTTLQQAMDSPSEVPNVVQLKDWVDQYRDLSDLRDRLHTKEYQVYVTKAQDHAAKAEWPKAMDSLASAFWTTTNEDKFRQEPWLKEFTVKAFTYAEDLRKRGEWTDATRIYAELALVFPDNSTYKELRTRCAAHASLEATYNDPDWKDRLGGITPAMAQDAFGRIDKYYYSSPDLKKMGVDGVERLNVLAETTALFKSFNGLSNPEKRMQFIGKLHHETDVLNNRDAAAVNQLYATLEDVLAANRATVALPEEVIISEYVNGAFDALDRYSSMIWPAEQAEFRKHTTGEFSGVGIQISMENDRIKVFSPLEDTPAYKAGVEPGDTILAIDTKPVKGLTLEQAVRRITGEAGTSVTLTMERPGSGPFDVKMKRTKITVPTVKGWDRSGPEWNYFIDKESRVAFVRVTSFTETTTDAFRSTLEQLHKQGMKGVIVDLRVNPGGLLKTAVEMCEMFLPPGKDIVSTKGRASEPWQIKSRTPGEFAGLPLIILINDYSASASEIMAGALHAQGAALLVGERTWGKGSVQNPWPLGSSDAMLKLTTALYYLPFMERSIHRDDDSKEWGVAPDVQVKLTPKEARRVLELRRNSDVLPGKSGVVPAAATAPATQPGDDEPDEGDALVQNLKVDPQVETALLLMRVRLMSKEPWSIRMASASASPVSEKNQPIGAANMH